MRFSSLIRIIIETFTFTASEKKKKIQTKTNKIKLKIIPDNTQEKFPKPQHLLSQLYKNTEELG